MSLLKKISHYFEINDWFRLEYTIKVSTDDTIHRCVFYATGVASEIYKTNSFIEAFDFMREGLNLDRKYIEDIQDELLKIKAQFGE